jgi:PAS domain S-box-containing protein
MRRQQPKKRKAPPRPASSAGAELDRFFHLSLDLLCVAGFDGYFKRLNPAWERTLGWTTAELLARPYLDFVHPEDRERTLAEAQKLTAGADAIIFENRYQARDGSYRWLQWNSTPLSGRDLVYGVARDITDLKDAEQALRENEERTRLLIDRASDAFVAMSAGGRVTGWNEAAERLFGWTRAEAMGRLLADVILPARFREQHQRGLERFLATGEGRILNRRLEMPALHRNGHEIPVELSVTAVRYGDAVTFTAFLRDTTERRALERMKDEFISMVSHELRTPLTAMRGALGMLGDGQAGELPERARRLVESASDSAERLMRLTNDILDIERIEAGRFTLAKKECDAGTLARQAAEAMRPLAERTGVTLAVEPASARLRADPDRVLQALTNLLSNAIKFSAAGGTVRLTVEPRESEVLFQVRDHGRGIPPEHLEHVFDRFLQVEAADARERGGTGLGLYISRSIVEQHGGRIWAESAPGAGSTFAFALPRDLAA